MILALDLFDPCHRILQIFFHKYAIRVMIPCGPSYHPPSVKSRHHAGELNHQNVMVQTLCTFQSEFHRLLHLIVSFTEETQLPKNRVLQIRLESSEHAQ